MNLATLAAVTIFTSVVPAQAGTLDWPLYSPLDKVVCDFRYKFCADGTGVSATWTEHFLGYDAAEKMFGMDQSRFTFSNNTTCSTIVRSCWGGPDKSRAKIERIFGW